MEFLKDTSSRKKVPFLTIYFINFRNSLYSLYSFMLQDSFSNIYLEIIMLFYQYLQLTILIFDSKVSEII